THPNIARLLDGGSTPDGRPYLVMELVDGEQITDYADTARLDIPSRLELVLAVAEAVSAAHRQLVVHRDIKPSNILVGRDGVPKLLDFGIAKLLAADAGAETTIAIRLMTPSYAAPEQLRGERITVATDVYALGVLLYELLTGMAPFPADDNEVTTQRRILEDEPRAPAEALRARTAAAGELLFSITPRQLRGDLDNIVLRALEKDPARRYRSVAELAADITAFLAGEPVRARPATAGYRMRKFLHRNRVPVAAAAVVLLTLSGGLAATAWQAQAAESARGDAVSARGDAEAAAARATEVTNFLVSLFAASDPSRNGGVEPSVRELLEEGIARVDSLSEQPTLQAELLMTLGQVQRWRGEYRSSADLYARASALWRGIDAAPDTALVTSTNIRGIVLTLGGFPDSAVTRFEEALALAERDLGEEHGITLSILANLAVSKDRQGADAEADALYSRLVALEERVLPPDHPDRSYTLGNLGLRYAVVGRFAEAEPLLREALRIVSVSHGEDSPDQAVPRENLGMMLREAGRYDEAESYLREGFELRRRILGETHRYVAESLFSNGLNYALRGRPGDHARADSMLRASLAMYDATVGSDHPGKAYTFHALGQLEMERGNAAAAERWYREALALRSQPRDAPRETARTRTELAHSLRMQGHAAEAGALMEEAWNLARESLRDGDPVHSLARIGMGLVLADGGDIEAAAFYAPGVAALAGRIGAQHPVTRLACARGRERGLTAAVCR
ncbi:MAG TPA: serine/threonine-protein kinase, partial [Longimicrobiales bacterium]